MAMLLALSVLFLWSRAGSACTTFVVGKKATKDGSVMATHSNDGGGKTDPRLVYVPPADYPAGSKRAIYYPPENYPRYVGYDRNVPEYFPENCQAGEANCKAFTPIGYIDQVSHTYGYFEATYGIMNEHQVGIAESTCSGVFATLAAGHGGKALMSIDALSQIAMERAKTSREAVEIIGELAEKYGFFGESASFEGGSESLIITDPNEAWVFHILADPTGTSAIWAAARVPDDSVAVVANMFSIREIDLNDTTNYLGRKDMWELAIEYGLYEEGQSKDFTKTFSDGEYAHKYYSGRRMWGVFRLLAPSQELPANYNNLKEDAPYPFAVPVDSPVTPQQVMAVMRDWYNGTVYSTGYGLASGPFNSPDRYTGGYDYAGTGSWERTIAIYRSSDSYVVQSRSAAANSMGGVIWYGPGAAHATSYVPVFSGNTRSPDCLAWGWQGVYNLTTSYWAHRSVLNLMQVKFNAMVEVVQSVQNQLESASQQLVDYFSGEQLPVASQKEFNQLMEQNVQASQQAFMKLFHYLMFTFADGNHNYWQDDTFHADNMGYPQWWLKQVGYEDGPEPINNAYQKRAYQYYSQQEQQQDQSFSKGLPSFVVHDQQ